MSTRAIVLVALGYWLSTSALVFALNGDELDMDTVYPAILTGEEHTERVILYDPFVDGPIPTNPPPAVIAAFVVTGVVIGLPTVLPKRWLFRSLVASMVLVGLALVVSILRLGVLLAPVVALQIWALARLQDASCQQGLR